MTHRKLFPIFILLFGFSTLVFAGSFLETAHQAKESGQVCKPDESGKTDEAGDANQGQGDRIKDSPLDHDNGKGNDDKDDKPNMGDNGQGDNPDQGNGQDPILVDPEDPIANPDVDKDGAQNPSRVKDCGTKELVRLITVKFQVKIVGGCQGESFDANGNLWTRHSLWELYRTLYGLPKAFFGKKFEVRRLKVGLNNPWVEGFVSTGTRCINICDEAVRKGTLGDTLVKEMGRCHVSDDEGKEIHQKWMNLFWHNEREYKTCPPVSCKWRHPREDFSESVRLYRICGRWFRLKDMARYEFIRRFVMKGCEFRGKNCGSCFVPPKPPCNTSTKTVTGTKTQTCTQTRTSTSTATRTSTATKTCTATRTQTCTKTQTGTVTKTNTSTGTKTGSATGTKTSTGTQTSTTGKTSTTTSTATSTTTGTATGKPGNTGGGDHGASGKPDENSKNNPNNPGPGTKPGSSGGNNPPNSNGNSKTTTDTSTGTNTETGTNKGNNAGGGDHGASGKTDENSKNNPNNPGPGTNPGDSSGKNSNGNGNSGKK